MARRLQAEGRWDGRARLPGRLGKVARELEGEIWRAGAAIDREAFIGMCAPLVGIGSERAGFRVSFFGWHIF